MGIVNDSLAFACPVRVVTEKPMTTDVEKCRRINQTAKETGGSLTVTFNYRYNPVHEAVKRLIASGEIGSGTYPMQFHQ